MLQDHITPSRIANSILQKTSFKGSYVIVEGKNDYTVYKKFSNENSCQIEIAFGNSNVIDVIEELNRRGFQNVVGIIDSDFRILEEENIANNNIFLTDDHDLELMILKSDAFDIVISHYSNQEKLDSFLNELKDGNLKDFLIELASPLGYLKWANKRNDFGLLFKPLTPDGNPLPISDFIPYKTMKFSGYERMIEVVFNYSRQKTKINIPPVACLEQTIALIKDNIDFYQLCNGHDVVTIICLALRNKISNKNSAALQPSQFEEALIFSYDSRFFETTNLYKQIKSWETKHQRTILKF